MVSDQTVSGCVGVKVRSVLVVIGVALMASACSSTGELPSLENTSLASNSEAGPGANTGTVASVQAAKPSKSELDKAIDYWGKQYEKSPKDIKAALAYARNLKAANRKQEAFGVLQTASILHGDNKELASEYGRSALDFNQVQLAQSLLTMAHDPSNPDWRLISALGTVQAKQGNYAEAIPLYEQARAMSHDQPSILNNLALAYAADGQPQKAEEMIRIAAENGDGKVEQISLSCSVCKVSTRKPRKSPQPRSVPRRRLQIPTTCAAWSRRRSRRRRALCRRPRSRPHRSR